MFAWRIVSLILAAAVCLLIGSTAYRMSARGFRFAQIESEVHEGHVTDRWGQSQDPRYDAGAVWGAERKAEYDQMTSRFQAALGGSILLAFGWWIVRSRLRVRPIPE